MVNQMQEKMLRIITYQEESNHIDPGMSFYIR